MKEWLSHNKHVIIVTHDCASAHAVAIREIMLGAMQIPFALEFSGSDKEYREYNYVARCKKTVDYGTEQQKTDLEEYGKVKKQIQHDYSGAPLSHVSGL